MRKKGDNTNYYNNTNEQFRKIYPFQGYLEKSMLLRLFDHPLSVGGVLALTHCPWVKGCGSAHLESLTWWRNPYELWRSADVALNSLPTVPQPRTHKSRLCPLALAQWIGESSPSHCYWHCSLQTFELQISLLLHQRSRIFMLEFLALLLIFCVVDLNCRLWRINFCSSVSLEAQRPSMHYGCFINRRNVWWRHRLLWSDICCHWICSYEVLTTPQACQVLNFPFIFRTTSLEYSTSPPSEALQYENSDWSLLSPS